MDLNKFDQFFEEKAMSFVWFSQKTNKVAKDIGNLKKIKKILSKKVVAGIIEKYNATKGKEYEIRNFNLIVEEKEIVVILKDLILKKRNVAVKPKGLLNSEMERVGNDVRAMIKKKTGLEPQVRVHHIYHEEAPY